MFPLKVVGVTISVSFNDVGSISSVDNGCPSIPVSFVAALT